MTEEIADLLIKNQNSIQEFLKDNDLGCFEIVKLRKK